MLLRYSDAQGVEYAVDNKIVYEIAKLDDLLLPKNEKVIITNTFNERFKLDFSGVLFGFQKLPLFESSQKLKLIHRDHAAYLIVCYKENRFYIGSSSNVAKRLGGHRNRLISGINANRNMLELFKRNTKEDFQVMVLESTSKEAAFELEQSLMDYFKNDSRKLNISEDAKDSTKFIPTEEAKNRRKLIMSAKMKIVHADPEFKEWHRAKITEAYKDPEVLRKHTEAINARLNDPVFRKEYDKTMREKVWSNPDGINARRAGLARFNADPEAKRKKEERASITFSNPEYRKRASEIATLRLADPELRKAHSEKLKKYYSNDENRERAFEANKHLAKQVRIEGVVYKSIHEASKVFETSRPTVKFRIESDNPKFESWTYV